MVALITIPNGGGTRAIGEGEEKEEQCRRNEEEGATTVEVLGRHHVGGLSDSWTPVFGG